MNITGFLVNVYCICKREVWLMARNISPDEHHEDIELGRFMHEHTYQRKGKEIAFGNVKFDVLLESKDKLVIGEQKKSSRFQEAAEKQLLFYLKKLKEAGLTASGVLLYPSEKKRVEVELTAEAEQELDDICIEIEKIAELPNPPKPQKCKYCKKCGYEEYCWS